MRVVAYQAFTMCWRERSRESCDTLFGFTITPQEVRTNWEIFRSKLKKGGKVTFIGKTGAEGGAGKRKTPEWARKLRNKVRLLIEQTRDKDPKTEYLPDRFFIYFSQSWRGVGTIYDQDGRKKNFWMRGILF